MSTGRLSNHIHRLFKLIVYYSLYPAARHYLGPCGVKHISPEIQKKYRLEADNDREEKLTAGISL